LFCPIALIYMRTCDILDYMMKSLLTLCVISLLFCPVSAFALDDSLLPDIKRLSVTPAETLQGSPFVVRILDKEISAMPAGAFSGKKLRFSACGHGCYQAIGVAPLNIDPGDYNIKINTGGGAIESVPLKVLKGQFSSQSLTLAPDKVNLSPEDRARANADSRMLKALWRKKTQKLWDGSFIMPLEGSYSTAFGVRRTINKTKLSIHSGVDIRGAYGTPVLAANSGVVAVADDTFYGGNTIVLDHGLGIYTVYMHLQEFRAASGQVVSKGDVIGLVGSTGRSTGPHLHYTVKVDGSSTNPTAMASLPLADEEIRNPIEALAR